MRWSRRGTPNKREGKPVEGQTPAESTEEKPSVLAKTTDYSDLRGDDDYSVVLEANSENSLKSALLTTTLAPDRR